MSETVDSNIERPDMVDEHLREIEGIALADDSRSPIMSTDRLVLLSDHDSVVVWWFLSAGGLARARANLAPDAQVDLVLRIYLEGAKGRRRTLDLEINLWADQQRVPVDRRIRQVAAAIGYRDGESFAHIVRAAPILRTINSQRDGAVRTSTLDWQRSGRVVDTGKIENEQSGASLNRYVYGGSVKDVRTGLIDGGHHGG